MHFLLFILLLIPATARATDVHLAAAASLRELVMAVATCFEKLHPEHRVLVNAAASGTLARQIEAGAPADLFLSSNPQWMTYLVERDKIARDRPLSWAANRLVVVGRGGALTSLAELAALQKLAIGSPESVPAGRYARSMLQNAGLYAGLEADRRLVFTKDVRQALLFAEQGVVDGAIVYASDARLLQQARILLDPEAELQPQISYPIALTRAGEDKPAAQRLFALLISVEGAQLIETYGLIPLTGSGE